MLYSKPVPLLAPDVPARRLCPVCGAVAYSIAGMHPQCAMQQADPFHVTRLRAQRKIALKSRKSV